MRKQLEICSFGSLLTKIKHVVVKKEKRLE